MKLMYLFVDLALLKMIDGTILTLCLRKQKICSFKTMPTTSTPLIILEINMRKKLIRSSISNLTTPSTTLYLKLNTKRELCRLFMCRFSSSIVTSKLLLPKISDWIFQKLIIMRLFLWPKQTEDVVLTRFFVQATNLQIYLLLFVYF